MTTNLEQRIVQLFKLDQTTWERHANPWSVWTRFLSLPLLILAIWSRIWIGEFSLVFVMLTILWIWINPRLFAKPPSTNNWASKAVLGERIWIDRDRIKLPAHHALLPNLINTISALALVFLIWGLIKLDIQMTLFTLVIVLLCKFWFLDRMVWLFDEMKD